MCVRVCLCVCTCVYVCACVCMCVRVGVFMQSLTVEAVPDLFFPDQLPLVVADDAKTAWPGPVTATCTLRTYETVKDDTTNMVK
jgi:hypothetical protein